MSTSTFISHLKRSSTTVCSVYVHAFHKLSEDWPLRAQYPVNSNNFSQTHTSTPSASICIIQTRERWWFMFLLRCPAVCCGAVAVVVGHNNPSSSFGVQSNRKPVSLSTLDTLHVLYIFKQSRVGIIPCCSCLGLFLLFLLFLLVCDENTIVRV